MSNGSLGADTASVRSHRSALALAVAMCLTSCGDDGDDEVRASRVEAVAIDADDPSACGSCHAAIVEEWRTSTHAHAHHDQDPIYAAMRRFRMGREGEELAPGCAQCHAPRAPEHDDSPAARVGVGCASCHAIASIDSHGGTRLGAGAITWSDGPVMRGPHDIDADAPAPHGTGEAAPWITDGRSVCLTCHDAMSNAQGVATCTTGPEHLEAGSDVSCAGCHMPLVERSSGVASSRPRHRSHAFLGPHRSIREDSEEEDFASSHVIVGPALENGTLSATIENRSGHAMPTGFPGRTIIVRAVGYDAAGEAVWRSFRDDPLREDPGSVLHRAYVDADEQPTLPPYGARLARDTRLRPGESRTLTWPVPEGVVRAEVALLYRLLPPAAAQRIGLEDPHATAPRTLLSASTP